MPSKVTTTLFKTWATLTHNVGSVKNGLLLGICFEQPKSSIHSVDFWLTAVIDKAVGVIETMAKSICTSLFRLHHFSLKHTFAICPAAPHLKHAIRSLISCVSTSASFIRHQCTIFPGLLQRKHFRDSFDGVFDVTKAILGASLLLRSRVSPSMGPATALS